jgi:hypothetical protein
MSRQADVDKLVSGFLSELDTLSDSLGLPSEETAADSRPGNGQVNAADHEPIAPSDSESPSCDTKEFDRKALQEGNSSSTSSSPGAPLRNIDVLLMSNNRTAKEMNQSANAQSQEPGTLQNTRPPRMSLSARLQQERRVLFRMRCSPRWPPITTWIQKLRGSAG